MSIIQGNAKQGSTRGFYNFPIEQSLRFNDDDGAYLSWTPTTPTNQYKWTWSGWVKYSTSTTDKVLFSSYDGSDTNNRAMISFDNGVNIGFTNWTGGTRTRLISNAVFRDPSAWYHIVVEFDSTQATDSNRTKIYVNGEQVTSFSSAQYIAQNQSELNKSGEPHQIGSHGAGSYFDGYLAEVNFIDGTALDADSFGEFKENIWIPKDPSGLTYGTNGFRLSFADDAEVEAFNTVLYRGNGTSQSVTGMGFQPDLVWIKQRDGTGNHWVVDAVRGRSKGLYPESTSAEVTSSSTQDVTSFDSDGFSLGTSYGATTNGNGNSFVAWGWKAGDSNVSNTDGSITSTVRANTTYGFSIVSYTGNATAGASFGHGLGQAPDFVIFKNRSITNNWPVYHSSIGSSGHVRLNLTDADNGASITNSTDPTSSVFTMTDWDAVNGTSMIAYCWAEKAGYSKFGSYTGTGSAGKVVDGFGFAPAWVLIKRTDSADDWAIYDNTRNTSNPATSALLAQSSGAEVTNGGIDFDSDGFELKDGGGARNASGGTYIYAAFADTREAAFWLDQSGNDNDWQPVNLDHNDTVADSPTDNFATWNPLDKDTGITLSDGNLQATAADSASHSNVRSTIALPSSGQFYAEFRYTATIGGSTAIGLGLADQTVTLTDNLDGQSGFWGIYSSTSTNFLTNGGSGFSVSTGSVGDILQIAYDADAEKMWYGLNNSWYDSSGGTTGNPSTGANPTASSVPNGLRFIGDVVNSGGQNLIANFGQQPFKYDPPA